MYFKINEHIGSEDWHLKGLKGFGGLIDSINIERKKKKNSYKVTTDTAAVSCQSSYYAHQPQYHKLILHRLWKVRQALCGKQERGVFQGEVDD